MSAQARTGGSIALPAALGGPISPFLAGNKRGSMHWTDRVNVKPSGLKMALTISW